MMAPSIKFVVPVMLRRRPRIFGSSVNVTSTKDSSVSVDSTLSVRPVEQAMIIKKATGREPLNFTLSIS